MSKQNLSKQDLWLIRNWERARQFEEAMASAREHYEQLFYKVKDKVKEKPTDLGVCQPYQLSEKVPEADWKYSGGCVGFCKPKWRGDWNSWPPGIWIWNISLDELVTERVLPFISVSASTLEGGWKSCVSACASGPREIHAGAN